MKLQQELKLKQPLASNNHEALLNLVRTASMLLKLSDRFFGEFGITDAQFNILIILNDSENDGLSQQELSHNLIVTKSNMVGLIDRLESSGLVARKEDPADRRCYRVVLTEQGKLLVNKVQKSYFQQVDKMMNVLTGSQKKTLIGAMERLRQYLLEGE